MLHALVLAALAAVTPSPTPSASPSPAPSAQPLQVIATVHATSSCVAIVSHANTAINSALANNATLGSTIRAMKTGDYDDNAIQKRKNLDALGVYAKMINDQALAGDAEVKRLRKLADATTDPDQKKDLQDFADALGGAMWRQRQVARDLNGMLAAMDFYDMNTLDEDQRNMNQAAFGADDAESAFMRSVLERAGPSRGVISDNIQTPWNGTLPTFGEMAAAAARDFTLRLPDIARDEATAASHVAGATKGC